MGSLALVVVAGLRQAQEFLRTAAPSLNPRLLLSRARIKTEQRTMASQHASTSSQTARSSSKRKLEVSVADSSVAGPVLGELPPP